MSSEDLDDAFVMQQLVYSMQDLATRKLKPCLACKAVLFCDARIVPGTLPCAKAMLSFTRWEKEANRRVVTPRPRDPHMVVD